MQSRPRAPASAGNPAGSRRGGIAWPWLDRGGAFSWLKLAALLAVLAPAAWILWQALTQTLGAKPVTEAIHQSGDWAVRLLLATLAVTPLRRIGNWPRLILIRRILGVSVFCYALLHLSLYVVDQNYRLWTVVSEIALRFYLTIGFTALVGLSILTWTSTDSWVKRLGSAWSRLHSFVYGIAVLALVHFFLQSKVDVTQAVLMTGFFYLAMGHRGLIKLGLPSNPATLLGLALFAGLATAATEALWYFGKTGVDPLMVLQANLDVEYTIRPALWVTGAGLALALLGLLRPAPQGRGRPKRGGRLAEARPG